MSKIDLLITTGNYKPDIGGPATFLNGLENYLYKKNITFILVAVVSQKKFFVKENNIIKIKREIPYFISS